jgi:hypothetical protein
MPTAAGGPDAADDDAEDHEDEEHAAPAATTATTTKTHPIATTATEISATAAAGSRAAAEISAAGFEEIWMCTADAGHRASPAEVAAITARCQHTYDEAHAAYVSYYTFCLILYILSHIIYFVLSRRGVNTPMTRHTRRTSGLS